MLMTGMMIFMGCCTDPGQAPAPPDAEGAPSRCGAGPGGVGPDTDRPLGHISAGDGSDGGGPTDITDDIRREAALRIHQRESLRARHPQSKGLAPLDLFLGAAAAEIARQVIRRGLRLLLK